MKTANIYDPGANENDYLFMFNGEPVTGTGPVPTGTIQIISNGQHDVSDYATADVNVPQGITPSGSKSITENGTYDVTQYASAEVNVPQGSAVQDQIKALGVNAFTGTTLPEKVIFPNVTSAEEYSLRSVGGTKIIVLPAIQSLGQYVFTDGSVFEVIDLGRNCPNFTQWMFSQCNLLTTLILRKDTLVTLAGVNAFSQTPFASDGTGGTLYVPQSLISSYQSASYWLTILGYANNQILPIEGSIYETHYADGTLIGG